MNNFVMLIRKKTQDFTGQPMQAVCKSQSFLWTWVVSWIHPMNMVTAHCKPCFNFCLSLPVSDYLPLSPLGFVVDFKDKNSFESEAVNKNTDL